MWPMICLHVSIWCCKTTINQKNKPKNPTGPPLCSGHAGGPLGNVLLHLMDAFDGVYLWQQSTCTWNRKWVMENKADVGAVQLYDSTHRSRQGVTYSAVHWRHSSALTAVIGNGVVACGAQRACMCDGVCVCTCVWMCSQHCCGDSESEKQTENQREAPGCPSTSLAPICSLEELSIVSVVCFCVCVWEFECTGAEYVVHDRSSVWDHNTRRRALF